MYVSVLDLATAGHPERPATGSMPRSCTTEALYRCDKRFTVKLRLKTKIYCHCFIRYSQPVRPGTLDTKRHSLLLQQRLRPETGEE